MTEEQIQYLAVENIECRTQVRTRFDEESITGLARSLQETDRILQPLRVRRIDGGFVVLDGERRLRAARKAGFPKVPVIIEDKEMCEAEIVHRQLILDWQRVQLTPVERAKAIQRLMEDSSWSRAEVAKRLGVSSSLVTKVLAVLQLPESVQDQVRTGALGMSSAYAIACAEDAETKAQLIKEAVDGQLTREGVAKRTKKSKRRGKTPRRPLNDRKKRVVLVLGGHCSLTVSATKITIEEITARLSEFLTRLEAVQPKDMELADAAKLLSIKGK